VFTPVSWLYVCHADINIFKYFSLSYYVVNTVNWLVYLGRNGTGLVSKTYETIRNNLIGTRNKLISSLN